jgi:exodeoxyribonuclease VII small subunit
MTTNKKPSQLSLEPEASPPPEAVKVAETRDVGSLATATPRTPQNEVSFEDAIERLSQIVDALESEGLPLETSLKLFEEGVRLARNSQARLETAERKVQELLAFDENGRPIVDELDPD